MVQAFPVLPTVALSSDFITGFCGETEEEHRDTVSLLEAVRYDMAYMFAYRYATARLLALVASNVCLGTLGTTVMLCVAGIACAKRRTRTATMWTTFPQT